jgi:hypothetical protein
MNIIADANVFSNMDDNSSVPLLNRKSTELASV